MAISCQSTVIGPAPEGELATERHEHNWGVQNCGCDAWKIVSNKEVPAESSAVASSFEQLRARNSALGSLTHLCAGHRIIIDHRMMPSNSDTG